VFTTWSRSRVHDLAPFHRLHSRQDGGIVVVEVGRDSAMIDQAVERFERQLTHHIGGFRDDIREGEAALHTELRVLEASLRNEMAALQADRRDDHTRLRIEIHDVQRVIVRESLALGATLRKDMADQRVAQLKWWLAFWLGQFAALVGLLALLLRT
jgi:hypothetical protein